MPSHRLRRLDTPLALIPIGGSTMDVFFCILTLCLYRRSSRSYMPKRVQSSPSVSTPTSCYRVWVEPTSMPRPSTVDWTTWGRGGTIYRHSLLTGMSPSTNCWPIKLQKAGVVTKLLLSSLSVLNSLASDSAVVYMHWLSVGLRCNSL